MHEGITSVGIDAHKRELHVAMLIGAATTPVVRTVEHEPKAIERLHGKLEREVPGLVGCVTKLDRAATRCSDS